jgi:glycosyltransferase involved in cell wall biosynthesis
MMQQTVVFIFNLLQDVNVIRPLAYIAARDMGMPVLFLFSHRFCQRDDSGIWRQELEEMKVELGGSLALFHDSFEALGYLEGKAGFLVAGSESNLPAHDVVHNLLNVAPPSFVRITLQHGFECVGFRQSRDQNMAHGQDITSAADILCGWFPLERMSTMAASQRSKLYISGPPMALQTKRSSAGSGDAGGFVCENLHSPRFHTAGDFKMDFLQTFNAFCIEQGRQAQNVTLRPHPGGRYVLKNDVPLPDNVTLNTDPIYKVDLSRFSYGISAPSSVLIDMMLAGIPVAVWNDGNEVMDVGNYEGLTVIRSLQDWLDFSQAASIYPDSFLDKQARFLAAQQMPIEPRDVHRRFVEMFRSTMGQKTASGTKLRQSSTMNRRVMFISNGYIPTLQLSFVKPLADEAGIQTDFLLEKHMSKQFGKNIRTKATREWVLERLEKFSPDLLVFCRYSGPHVEAMTEWANKYGVPILFHIDDDLLDIPRDIGVDKYLYHNHPERLSAVRHLLDYSDLVYASTKRLKNRLLDLGVNAPVAAGKIYASGDMKAPAVLRPVRKIGYMASADHAHNLEMILPAVIAFLQRNPNVIFELFGSISVPEALQEFGEQIQTAPPVKDYENFLMEFAARKWDIGLCPLTPISFNLMKANTKWVEYTSVGTAVIASRGTVYDECCADDCGILASTTGEWLTAMEYLVQNPQARFEQVTRAQKKLVEEYSIETLRTQVLDMFTQATQLSNHKDQSTTKRRVVFIANGYIPTLQLSFVKPLAEEANIQMDLLLEEQMNKQFGKDNCMEVARKWAVERLEKFSPNLLVFCRYSGPHVEAMTEWARKNGVPTLFHIDDDLLNIPRELGEKKYQSHNAPHRIKTVRHLLNNADLVYASTERLKSRLLKHRASSPIAEGKIYASGEILKPAEKRVTRKFGYMGFDHGHDLETILPALVSFLRRNLHVSFELFGSIPKPSALNEFGDRISVISPVRDYQNFLNVFAEKQWDVGICPLAVKPFNLVKANTKWVEYTSVGTAVIASRGTVYDECCADDCGILASTTDEWLTAMEYLVQNPQARFEQVTSAQKKLVEEYSIQSLRTQVLDMFNLATELSNYKDQLRSTVNL